MTQIGGVDVPAQYVALVQQAAAGTGLPQSVVAAQIQAESSFNPDALSPAGAEGIFQFEPATYTGVGGVAGTEDNPADEVQAYITYMNSLLKQFNGNVLEALNQYNGAQTINGAPNPYGPGILAVAGETSTLTSGGGTGSTGTPPAGTPPTGTPGAPGTGSSTSATAAAGGFDPLSLLSDITGLARDVATVIDYVFGMFGRGQGWRLVFTLVFAVSGYGAYRCLAGAGAVPDIGGPSVVVI